MQTVSHICKYLQATQCFTFTANLQLELTYQTHGRQRLFAAGDGGREFCGTCDQELAPSLPSALWFQPAAQKNCSVFRQYKETEPRENMNSIMNNEDLLHYHQCLT